MTRVLVIGATSAIAEATARRYATEGSSLCLVGRDTKRLELIADDLKVRGAAIVEIVSADLADVSRHQSMLDDAFRSLEQFDVALIAHGVLSDQAACEQNVDMLLEQININGVSTVALMSRIANMMQAQGRGTLVVISSVAGDRGRKSNYVYGAAKSMVTAFAQGLRNRLYAQNVHIITVIPGFVDTPMTRDFDKGPLWASADDIAAGIVKAVEKQSNVVYLPFFWRYIMLLIRHIPEFIFKRMNL